MIPMNQVTIVKIATNGPAKLVPNRPPTAIPIPTSAAAYRPSTSVPATGVAISLPAMTAPTAIPTIVITVKTATPTSAATAPDVTQRLRDSGVASRNSSRPEVSSEAQTATSVAAARPARIIPNSTKRSCRKPPTDRMSNPGNTWLSSFTKSVALPSWSMNDLPEPAIASPNRPIPMPQAIDEGRFWPIPRPVGPWSPTSARGRLGVGIGLVAPISRRANASTPTTKRINETTATGSERRPVELARERDVVRRPAEPGQVRQWRDRRDRGLVAVEDEPAEHDGPGDTGGRSAPHERRQRECHRAGRDPEQEEPDGVARRHVER